MKKSPSKKILEAMPLHSDADAKRYVGFVTESYRDELKVVGERIQLLDESMRQKFSEVGMKLDRHEEILNAHTDMIGRLMIDVEEIKLV